MKQHLTDDQLIQVLKAILETNFTLNLTVQDTRLIKDSLRSAKRETRDQYWNYFTELENKYKGLLDPVQDLESVSCSFQQVGNKLILTLKANYYSKTCNPDEGFFKLINNFDMGPAIDVTYSDEGIVNYKFNTMLPEGDFNG